MNMLKSIVGSQRLGYWFAASMLCIGGLGCKDDAGQDSTRDPVRDPEGESNREGQSAAKRCLSPSFSVPIAADDAVRAVDLLLVVDSSLSMVAKQRALAEGLPGFLATLQAGELPDGRTFPSANSVQVGVVTTDLGVPGLATVDPSAAQALGCSAQGDDARLRTISGENEGLCAGRGLPEGERFFRFDAADSSGAQELAETLACVAQVGAEGCGYEMQLESALKAVWPYPAYDLDQETGAPYVDAATGEPWLAGTALPYARVSFLASDLSDPYSRHLHSYGQGGHAILALDADGKLSPVTGFDDQAPMTVANNSGFVRIADAEQPSLLAVVLLTDEDDCSSRTTRHFHPTGIYGPNSPYPDDEALGNIAPNLRCMAFADSYIDGDVAAGLYLHPTDRYVKALNALSPNEPERVVFAAIAGVPPDLVSAVAQAEVDFDSDASRAAYYRGILEDGRMEKQSNGVSDGLVPACQDVAAGTGAEPAVRVTEAVAGFGRNGLLKSICDEDLDPALDDIAALIGSRLGATCLSYVLPREEDGTVPCELYWELSEPGAECDQLALSFLEPAPALDSGGKTACQVSQVSVVDGQPPADMEGWYYDDFSAEVASECQGGDDQQRIVMTTAPPEGVQVRLVCGGSETARQKSGIAVDDTYYDDAGREPPTIGSPCQDDSECVLRLADGTVDERFFCHARRLACVQHCVSASENSCPSGWSCDEQDVAAERESAAGPDRPVRNLCVNLDCEW